MATAVITYVYNEKTNLPIWIKYYGSLFGIENLFIADRGSTDGSTDNLGGANLLGAAPRVRRGKKTDFVSSLQRCLLELLIR